jgi:uncharacterized protein YjiK
MSYTTTVSNNNVTISVATTDHSISLSRTGGQGTKGDSVSRVYFDNDKNLLVEIVNAAGTVVETINAGSMKERIDLIDLLDVDYTSIADGDFIIYEATTQKFTTHTFTTTSITDIDNTNKTDGALLVYNGTTNKYTATTEIENPNTSIIGGFF